MGRIRSPHHPNARQHASADLDHHPSQRPIPSESEAVTNARHTTQARLRPGALIAAAPDDHRHHPFERFNVQTSEQSITTNNSATTPKTSGAQHKGRRYPADPPTVEEIIAVMRTAGAGPDGMRVRALIVVLWRAGLRIGEALALAETDLDARRRAVLVRHGKGDKRREVGMDTWAWEHLEPWQQLRIRFPVGPFFCVIHGPTVGRNWEPASARRQLSRTAAAAGVRRRFAPHQLRHAHAIEMAHERIPLPIIQRQLGHAHLGVTSIYLQGIDNAEIIDAVHARRPPVIPATVGLRTAP